MTDQKAALAADYLRLAGEREDIEKQAAHLRELKPDWDSYGAKPITEEAIQSALKCLASPPHLTPRHNGGVQIDWASGAEISFEPDGDQELDNGDDTCRRYEQKISSLEAALESAKQHQLESDKRISNQREEIKSLTEDRDNTQNRLDTVRKMKDSAEAALAVAREAIESAPHTNLCAKWDGKMCDCWKSLALAALEGK